MPQWTALNRKAASAHFAQYAYRETCHSGLAATTCRRGQQCSHSRSTAQGSTKYAEAFISSHLPCRVSLHAGYQVDERLRRRNTETSPARRSSGLEGDTCLGNHTDGLLGGAALLTDQQSVKQALHCYTLLLSRCCPTCTAVQSHAAACFSAMCVHAS